MECRRLFQIIFSGVLYNYSLHLINFMLIQLVKTSSLTLVGPFTRIHNCTIYLHGKEPVISLNQVDQTVWTSLCEAPDVLTDSSWDSLSFWTKGIHPNCCSSEVWSVKAVLFNISIRCNTVFFLPNFISIF